jgi:hypothetical protein
MTDGRSAAAMRTWAIASSRAKRGWPLRIVLALLVSCSAMTLRAQTGTATLSGTVVDPAGKVVPGVEVKATNVDTGTIAGTKTNGDGIYVLSALPPGHYRMLVTVRGFKQIALTDITLSTQDSISRNFSLEVGAVSETVTVNADNERMPTDSPAVGLLVNRDFIENMPLNGRSLQDLLALAPGAVTENAGQNVSNNLFSINGQSPEANYFTVDGVAANLGLYNSSFGSGIDLTQLAGIGPSQSALGTTQSLASLDSLQEFKIQTAGYSAEYGRQPGGQVELRTRSGTNDIHGSLFDYFRNTVFDANSWIGNNQGIPRQAERQNDFGGTVGGPLHIPRIYNGKNKTFYFVSYEGLRLDLPSYVSTHVPSMELRAFAAPGVQEFLDSNPIPNGQESGDRCAASLQPDSPAYAFSCTALWSRGYSSPNSLDSLSFRVDEVIGQKIQIFARYADTPSSSSSYTNSELDTITGNGHTWTIGSTVNLAANLLDEVRFNYSESEGYFIKTPVALDGAIPYSRSSVIPSQYLNGPAEGDAIISLPGSDYFYTPAYENYGSQQHQYNVLDGVTWVRGTHTLKFGVDYRRLSPVYDTLAAGSASVITSVPSVQQGVANTFVTFAGRPAYPIFANLSLYAQDHWKAKPNLTLDYGVRWELNPPPGASDGLLPLTLTSSDVATAELAPAGTRQYKTKYDRFAPRVGFAYSLNPSTTHATVLRGGFGVFYDTGQNLGATGYAGYPFSAYNFLQNVPLPASSSALAPPALNVPLVPPYGDLSGASNPDLTLPYTEEWNLTLDENLSPKNTLSVSYVGNDGKKLLFSEYYSSTVNPLFPNGISLSTNAGNSKYNALQVQDQGYVAEGMQLIASYTWAHATDNLGSDTFPVSGNSDNDIRQVFNAALNYQIRGASSGRFLHVLTSGWSLDNRITAQSGYPVDVYQGVYYLPNGTQEFFRPDLVPDVPIYLHNQSGVQGGWELNPNAFSPVPTDPTTGAPLATGTLGRNYIHGPNFWNLNTSVQRSFALKERLHLLFRADAFNIFNHNNPGGIDPYLPDGPGTFGAASLTQTIGVPNQLYASGAARSFQFMLKLQF